MNVDAELTPFSVVLALGAAQGVFLAIAVLTAARGNRKANWLLAALIAAFVLDIVDEFLAETGYIAAFPKLAAFNWALDFVFGPLIWLYARELSRAASAHRPRWPPHFVPFGIALTFVMALWASLSAHDFRTALAGDGPVPLQIGEAFLSIASVVSMATYLAASIVLIRGHQRRVKMQLSYMETVGLRWLRSLLVTLSIVFVVYVVSGTAADDTAAGMLTRRMLYVSMVVAIFVMGFRGLRQPRIFLKDWGHPETPGKAQRTTVQAPRKKYRHSSVTGEQAAMLLEQIRQLMRDKRLYLRNALSLPEVAAEVGLSANIVSQAINEGAGVNFFEFVNAYRIEEARRLLEDSDKSIVTVALDAGFNSKTAFYSAFRKHCGTTPRQYRLELGQPATRS